MMTVTITSLRAIARDLRIPAHRIAGIDADDQFFTPIARLAR